MSPSALWEPGWTTLRRAALCAVVVSAAVAVLGGSGSFAATQSTPVDAGYRDFSYGSGVSAPTAKELQSKTWFNDGIWWASLYNSASGDYEIQRLDPATQAWTGTGTSIDERENARIDVLWDGQHLYTVAAGTSETNASQSARVVRFTYAPATKTYTRDSGFPVTINGAGVSQGAVIAEDTTGTLWVTYTQSGKVWVTHTTTDDRTWVAPFVVPSPAATNILSSEDESAVVAFNGKIGIMWSNQNPAQWAYYWAVHTDGAPATQWQVSIAHQASEESDNHINLKALNNDPAGQVFAAVKTSLNASTAPLYLLLVLKPNGVWEQHVFGTVADDHTRAQVLLDPESRDVYMFATSPCCSGGSVYYKVADLDNISFGPGKGTPIIQSGTDTNINNVTSTKQPIDSSSGALVLAGDDQTRFYLHNSFGVGSGDTVAPDTTIDSGPSGIVDSTSAIFTFSSSEAGSTFECALDGGAFASCASPKSYTGLGDGSHTFVVRAIDAVGNVDLSPASRAWTINTSAVTLTFMPDADARVEQANPTTNYGTATLLGADLSPQTETYLRFPVTNVNGPVVVATLRLYATNGSKDGPAVYSAGNSWTETGLTWNSRPPRTSAKLDDKGTVGTKTWVAYDVLPAVAGNGTYTFRVEGTSTDGTDFSSREASTNKPQLVVRYAADTTPPETTIDSGPATATSSASASFEFSANEADSTFACSLDGAVFTSCSSPTTYAGLVEGSHRFDVRATDPSGNTDATPARRTWTIDRTPPPPPTILSPADGTTTANPTVVLTGSAEPLSEIAIYEGGGVQATGTADATGAWSATVSGLSDGSHRLSATATDTAGNTSAESSAVTITVDATPPDTTIESGPEGASTSTSATFAFSASEAGATFACSVDGGAFVSCTSPQTYDGLAEASHTFRVRAADALGNADPTPASRSWTVDVTAPTIVAVVPSDGAVGVSNSSSVQATFSESMDPATLTTATFTLEQAGSATAVAASVSYDAATKRATLTPSQALAAGTGYTAAVHAAAQDVAGNELGADRTWSFTTDTAPDAEPPETTIDSAPSGSTASTSATLVFSSTELGSTFECSLDGDLFAPCGSPFSFTGLTDGAHTARVRAIDLAGNTDPTPATATWTVDAIAPPAPVITSPAEGSTSTSSSVSVTGTAEPLSTVELFDGASARGSTAAGAAGAWSLTASDLADGAHTLATRARDAAGNMSPWSTAVHVTVDATLPETSIDSGPSGSTTSTSATFTFSSNDAGATFECNLDGGGFAGCASPKSYTGLAEGPHTFQARAIDAAGNIDPTPAARSWTVSLALFSDGFESGDFSAWTLVRTGADGSAVVESSIVKSGGFAAQLGETANTGSFAYVRKTLADAVTDITVSGDFQLLMEGASGGNVPFLRLFDTAGTRVISLYRQNASGDKVQLGYGGANYITSGKLPLNTWGNLQLHVVVAGTASTVEVRLNDTLVYQTTSASLGTVGIATIQIGNDTAKQTFSLVADNILARAVGSP